MLGPPRRCGSLGRWGRLLVLVRSEHVVERVPGFRNPWQSSALGVADDRSAPIAQMQQRRREWCNSIRAAVWLGVDWSLLCPQATGADPGGCRYAARRRLGLAGPKARRCEASRVG
jgi:hypothetical protein